MKGFTPERLTQVQLKRGEGVPFDRAFAVEDGPSGFDASAPAHVPKMRFTVLAKLPEVARVRTRFEDGAGTLHAEAPGREPIAAKLTEAGGRDAFAAWLTAYLGEAASGPLRVIPAPGAHRFYDSPQGFLSLINLESVREIGRRIGREVDPLRFRANFYVSGWPAWAELEAENFAITVGGAKARVFSPIRRCLATHANPDTGKRDIDMLEVLRTEFGHLNCGILSARRRTGRGA